MPLPAPCGLPFVRALPGRDGSLDRVTPLDAFVEVSDVDEGCVHGAGPRVRKLGAGAAAITENLEENRRWEGSYPRRVAACRAALEMGP
jgi:hypothetical protein